eukprot:2579094-Rhodomonas_salina.1
MGRSIDGCDVTLRRCDETGNARGFDVSTLPMLKSTLDNARQHSLLHYLLSICKSTHSDMPCENSFVLLLLVVPAWVWWSVVRSHMCASILVSINHIVERSIDEYIVGTWYSRTWYRSSMESNVVSIKCVVGLGIVERGIDQGCSLGIDE